MNGHKSDFRLYTAGKINKMDNKPLYQRFPNCGSRPQMGSICNLPGGAWQFAWGRLAIYLGSLGNLSLAAGNLFGVV